MITQSLREAGVDCEITSFDDGSNALRYIQGPSSRVPELMILDFNVPGEEGAAVLNAIRSTPRWAHIRVLVFTASRDPKDMARMKMLGVNEYLIKPMDLAGFTRVGRVVKEWLENTTTASA